MEVPLMQFPPGDPRVVDKIASQLKSQGIFDQFRKECISDVDTKPAYQNLHQRVEGTVASFLANQEWRPDLNKNQLRDSLRKHIHESGFLDIGVERIVDQVVNPKIMTVFLPQIEDVVYRCLGIEKPKKGKETQSGVTKQTSANSPQKVVTLKDLLPTDLDPISPESDGIKDGDDLSEDEEKEIISKSNEEEEEEEEEEEGGDEEEEEEEERIAEEEETSPPFEPIEEINSQCDETSMDSHLSGISDLTSHDSQVSNTSYAGNTHITNAKVPVIDLANHDSQLSKVSSGSRLSIVFSDDQEKFAQKPPASPPEIDIINDESQLSKSSLQILSQESQVSDNVEMSNQGSEESKTTNECIIVKDSSSDVSNLDTTTSSSKSPNMLCEKDKSEIPCEEDAGDIDCSKTDSEEKSSETEKVDKKHEQREDKKRSRSVSENGEVKKNEHERKRSDKYRRDRSDNKRPSRHDDRDRSDDKVKRDGSKVKENEKDTKKEKVRPDVKTDKEINKSEEREESKDKQKNADKIETPAHKSKSRTDFDTEKGGSTDLELIEDFGKGYEKLKSEELFGEDDVKPEENFDKEGSKKDDKSRHKSKYEYKKDKERYREKEKGKGRNDDKASKDGTKEKSRHDDKSDRDSSKDRDDRIKNDKIKLDDRVDKEGKDRSRLDGKGERDSSREKSKHEEKIEKEGNKQRTEDKTDKSRHDRSKHSEKGERDTSKDRSKHDPKQEKERRSDERGKVSSDKQSRERKDDILKGDEEDGDKREKSRSEVKKDKAGKEKSKHDDKGRSKNDNKHKESTKIEGKEDGSSRNEKSSRDRSGNRDSKSKPKSNGKENENRKEEKNNRDRSKMEERSKREKSSKSESKDKENHEKKVDGKRDDSDSGKSSRSSDHKSKKKDGKSKTVVDDHHIHHDKNSDDRRSTDRDSSGTQRSRAVSSRRSGSDSHSSHHHDKRDSNGSSGNNRSDGGGNSESAAEHPEDSSDQASSETSVSPSSLLPFKKRPVQNQMSDSESREEYSCTINAGKLILKSKKPKIAANIFEARKIMHLRKSMAKIERRKQREWRKKQSAIENAEHRSSSDLENDIPPIVLSFDSETRKEDSESGEEPLLFFNEEETHVDKDFIQYVKRLEKSETLSEISWESSDESDTEEKLPLVQSFTEDGKEPIVLQDEIQNINTSEFIEEDSKHNASTTFNDIINCESSKTSEINTCIEKSADPLESTDEPPFISSSNSIKSTRSRRSRIKREFGADFESHPLSRRASQRTAERENDMNDVITSVSPKLDDRVQNSNRRAIRRTRRTSESSTSDEEAISNPSFRKYDSISAEYTVENDREHSVSSDVVEVSRDPSPAHNLDYADSVGSTDDDGDDGHVHKNSAKVDEVDTDGDDYSYIRDNNNIDKSSSDDEKCGDGMSLSNELILPALRDLILESGFQLGDGLESADSLVVGSGMPTPDSQGEMSEKQSSAGSGGSTSNVSERKRPKFGRSRRVGLGKPHPSKRLEVGKRVATPPAVAADFVMPLSPESDVSASSVEQIRKGPANVKADTSALSEVAEGTNFAHMDNDSEERRHLRSSSTGTPARRSQVYSHEDLFKPRPLFSQRKHGQYSAAQVEEPVGNCVGKRRRSTIESDGPQTSKRMRR